MSGREAGGQAAAHKGFFFFLMETWIEISVGSHTVISDHRQKGLVSPVDTDSCGLTCVHVLRPLPVHPPTLADLRTSPRHTHTPSGYLAFE